MTDFKIVDVDGQWLKNACAMPMANGSRNLVYIPGMATKVTVGDWEKIQLAAGVLVEVEDPLKPAAEVVEVEVKAPEGKSKGKA